jgi:hypothetical protein
MAIKTGRYGTVKWDPDGAPSPLDPVEIISLNTWKLSVKKSYEDVTCFGDTNKVYVPGLPDISGSFSGFWNSDSTVLWAASQSGTPGFLQLAPNSNEPTFLFEGLGYLDADIDCSQMAPKITGTMKPGGPWTLPG